MDLLSRSVLCSFRLRVLLSSLMFLCNLDEKI